MIWACGAIRYCRRIAWPLGADEGRALAEAFFWVEAVEALQRSRYGAPQAWLIAYCRTCELEWASLAPRPGLGVDDAILGTWGGKPNKPLLIQARDAKRRIPDGVRWHEAMAELLDLASLSGGE